jgi:hypothetical protein
MPPRSSASSTRDGARQPSRVVQVAGLSWGTLVDASPPSHLFMVPPVHWKLAVSDQTTLANGALAARYSIERALGRGGRTTVYLARDFRHGRLGPVKALRPEFAAALVRRVLQEAIDTATPQGATAFMLLAQPTRPSCLIH